MRRGTLQRTGIGVAAATAAGYAWWVSALGPFTLPSLGAVMAGGAVAMALGARLPEPPPVALRRPGLRVGLAVVIAIGLWELASFLQHPRSEHPTISSLLNDLFASHPARTVGFLLWLTVTAELARRLKTWRPPVLAAWLWLGWHVFVRASYG
jgi:hypothetical protein